MLPQVHLNLSPCIEWPYWISSVSQQKSLTFDYYLRVVTKVCTATGAEVQRSAAICLATLKASSATLHSRQWLVILGEIRWYSIRKLFSEMNFYIEVRTWQQAPCWEPPQQWPVFQSAVDRQHARNNSIKSASSMQCVLWSPVMSVVKVENI